jgi:hypothetical protein
VEVLGELYGQYTSVGRLEDPERQWLESVGLPVDRNPDHDAGGLNDDWPIGRGVFIHDKRQFVVLVNFEDHIEIVILPEHRTNPSQVTNDNMREGLLRLIKLMHTFEKLGYATDPYLGNLTVSPKNLGTSLFLEADLKFQSRLVSQVDRHIVEKIELLKHLSV